MSDEEPKLQEEIAALEKLLGEKKATLTTKQAEADAATKDEAEVKAALKEAQEANNAATKARDAVVADEADLKPAYERAVETKELKERAKQCKADIAALEKQHADKLGEKAKMELELEAASAAFKAEKTAKTRLVARLTEAVDALKAAVTSKIAASVDGADRLGVDPFLITDRASDLVLERESELKNNGRLRREQAAVVEMKKDIAEKLQADTDAKIAQKKKDKHAMIKAMVKEFQDQRNVLQADIDEVRRVNADQAVNLTRGHVETGKLGGDVFKGDSTGGKKKGTAVVTVNHKRTTELKKDRELGESEKFIVTQNKDASEKLELALKDLKHEHARKTELAKTLKSTEHRIKLDKVNQEAKVRELEARVVKVVAKTKEIESANNRLSDDVEGLSTVVKTTKKQLERVRGRAAPLPIEDDDE